MNCAACLSLFTEPSEPLPEEPKPEEMPFHHCHRDPLPPPGLTPERLQAQRQLCAACAVCCVFMAGEVVGKLETSSSDPILSTPAPAALHPERASQQYSWVDKQRKGWLGWGVGCPGLRKWERVSDSTEGYLGRGLGAEGQGWPLSIS